MNGSVIVYKIGERISWNEFRSYPLDVRAEYLQHFVNKFGATSGMMADLFEVSTWSICNHIAENPELRGILKKSITKQSKEDFYKWLKTAPEIEKEKPIRIPKEKREKAPVVQEPIVVEKPKEVVTKPEMPYFAHVLRCGEFSLEGSGVEIASTLYGIFRDKRIMVELRFTEIPEEPEIEEPEVEETVSEVEVEEPIDDGMIDINTASFQQLRWAGFSNNLTLNVISNRPFAKMEDLMRVPGMNQKIFNEVKKRACVK